VIDCNGNPKLSKEHMSCKNDGHVDKLYTLEGHSYKIQDIIGHFDVDP
jgi:hypothetical protein